MDRCYKSLVRPIIEYACAAWDVHTEVNINKLELVQIRVARFVYGSYSRYSRLSVLIKELVWQLLAQRRARPSALLMYKIQSNFIVIHEAFFQGRS